MDIFLIVVVCMVKQITFISISIPGIPTVDMCDGQII